MYGQFAHVLSVNLTPVSEPRARTTPPDVSGRTGIDKQPIARIEVADPGPKDPHRVGSPSGVVGDLVVSLKHHGGSRQAVYAVAREELDHWERVLERSLREGMFGENLTTSGHDVDASVVGERWRITSPSGEVVLLEVAGPRIPCDTFARHLGVRGWVKAFAARGRTGVYLAVLTPGPIEPGARIEVEDRPRHGITVPDLFRALMGDLELAERVLAAHILHEPEHGRLAARLRRSPD